VNPFERGEKRKHGYSDTWFEMEVEELYIYRGFEAVPYFYSSDRGRGKDMACCWVYFGQNRSRHRIP
jgi:hypothetical protein